MAKSKTQFVCQDCGYETPRWLGKCPSCNAWGSLVEEIIEKGSGRRLDEGASKTSPIKLSQISFEDEERYVTGMQEFDRVLGGGVVKGSLVLVGGDPGIGKSTLLLQICNTLNIDGNILYVSGEESIRQIKMRADRLGVSRDNLFLISENNLELIEQIIEKVEPKMLIIDSIQTVFLEEISSAPGSVSQVREAASKLMHIAKKKNIATFIIGHVTKEGSIAGPRVLEHMVDAVLYLEGERHFSYRILRTVKNRFGSTNEIGMFEMKDQGLVEVQDMSSLLLSEKAEDVPGSVIVSTMEGSRPILVEIQSLVSYTPFGMPRRMANGLDYNRVILLTAVLEKRLGLNLSNQDVYVNIVGGIRLDEPAVDLGVIAAIASSFKNKNTRHGTVMIGEVGLTGEIRAVNGIEKRINEVRKSGYKCCIIPYGNDKLINKNNFSSIEIIGVKDVHEALQTCLD
ncbi:MAG: DNA repair protein RadA [Deltaproteobacteria bacterium]